MLDLTGLLVFIFICFGMTKILVHGHIFDRIRPERKFFHCPLCMGFWVGVVVYILIYKIYGIVDMSMAVKTSNFWITAVFMGFVSAGTSYVLSTLFSDEGFNIKHN